ncbi:unnamed protein product [Plutella xylostella]|uniref:(diamondback moth) hypothetical protein n=1 Tax=Plutella xylostella TaxID=51655 RepID=A0A8S4DPF8_PLUXY|nr:unnamed protein product [Plutella xylostella]
MLAFPAHKQGEQETAEHPLQRSILQKHLKKLKYIHNSANNPEYPKDPKEKDDESKKSKFVIIGSITNAYFIYCVKVVQKLHRYKSKIYSAPIIRGVTKVDWPMVYAELRVQYGEAIACNQNEVVVILDGEALGGEVELKKYVEERYTMYLAVDYYDEIVKEFVRFVDSSKRPFAYMHICIDEEIIGTLIFMLYADKVPITCENFLRLCVAKKGGYCGTPVHRIVKDGWIQCGGYGLENTASLSCENFSIPHDRRGVLCMANDGKHIDCSTQFFVMLQPLPWMDYKYVAFGQLVEGEETLKKIENVATYYEAPLTKIIICRAGVLNLYCNDVPLNYGAMEYIQGHIEDLVALADYLWEVILNQTFLAMEFKMVSRLSERGEGYGEQDMTQIYGEQMEMHATQRFMGISQELAKSKIQSIAEAATLATEDNNDFDVETYTYEAENETTATTKSIVVKPEMPYYIPLTDVPYPGEVDSVYDLKKLLKGDYCLESDLNPNDEKTKAIVLNKQTFSPEAIFDDDVSSAASDLSFDSHEEMQARKYLRLNSDIASFAGNIVKGIVKSAKKINTENFLNSKVITDEGLRRFRLAAKDQADPQDHTEDKKVSISARAARHSARAIQRRPTGFIRHYDIDELGSQSSMDRVTEGSRKVRIASEWKADEAEEDEAGPPSALQRLFDQVARALCNDDDQPLRDPKSSNEMKQKFLMMRCSPLSCLHYGGDDQTLQNYPPEGILRDNLLEIQHGKALERNISNDYVRGIEEVQQKFGKRSLRAIEFAKMRRSITVQQYQERNRERQTLIGVGKPNAFHEQL